MLQLLRYIVGRRPARRRARPRRGHGLPGAAAGEQHLEQRLEPAKEAARRRDEAITEATTRTTRPREGDGGEAVTSTSLANPARVRVLALFVGPALLSTDAVLGADLLQRALHRH